MPNHPARRPKADVHGTQRASPGSARAAGRTPACASPPLSPRCRSAARFVPIPPDPDVPGAIGWAIRGAVIARPSAWRSAGSHPMRDRDADTARTRRGFGSDVERPENRLGASAAEGMRSVAQAGSRTTPDGPVPLIEGRHYNEPRASANRRGRLLSTEDVRTEIYRGNKSTWWITHHFAPDDKIRQGRNCFWWEADAYAWLDHQRARTDR